MPARPVPGADDQLENTGSASAASGFDPPPPRANDRACLPAGFPVPLSNAGRAEIPNQTTRSSIGSKTKTGRYTHVFFWP